MAPLSTTITVEFNDDDRKLLRGLSFEALGAINTLLGEREGLRRYLLSQRDADVAAAVKTVTRERDRLRQLAEDAFGLLRPEYAGVQAGVAAEARDLLQNGLNATPLDSPDGTAGGQAYEERRRIDGLKGQIDQVSPAAELIKLRNLEVELKISEQVAGRLQADLAAATANLKRATDWIHRHENVQHQRDDDQKTIARCGAPFVDLGDRAVDCPTCRALFEVRSQKRQIENYEIETLRLDRLVIELRGDGEQIERLEAELARRDRALTDLRSHETRLVVERDQLKRQVTELNAKIDDTHQHRCFKCEKTITTQTADRQALLFHEIARSLVVQRAQPGDLGEGDRERIAFPFEGDVYCDVCSNTAGNALHRGDLSEELADLKRRFAAVAADRDRLAKEDQDRQLRKAT